MPVALVFSRQDVIPAIIYEDTADLLVDRLRALKAAPELSDEQEARQWLQSLPMPSGWFSTIDEASAHVQRLNKDTEILPGAEVKAARQELGLTQAEFAQALGLGGNPDTRRRLIRAIEGEEVEKKTGKPRYLGVTATQRLLALMAARGLETATK